MKIRVAILALEGVLPSAVLGLKDIFDICNEYCRQKNENDFKILFLGEKDKILLSRMQLNLTKISQDEHYDILIIPPIISRNDIKISIEVKQWLIKQYHKGTYLSAACMGSFVLAQTGLLDYKKATTHWLLEQKFKLDFPNIKLHIEKILIEENRILTSGGVTAYIDLALYIIEKNLSLETANKCASLLLVDRGRDSQRCYQDLASMILIKDTELKKLLKWMKDNLHKEIDIECLAKKMKLTRRSFTRRFKNEVHTTPIQYLQNLRIEAAKSLLITSVSSFELITYKVGFTNESSFRRLFKRETSLNPGEYRKKFKVPSEV